MSECAACKMNPLFTDHSYCAGCYSKIYMENEHLKKDLADERKEKQEWKQKYALKCEELFQAQQGKLL